MCFVESSIALCAEGVSMAELCESAQQQFLTTHLADHMDNYNSSTNGTVANEFWYCLTQNTSESLLFFTLCATELHETLCTKSNEFFEVMTSYFALSYTIPTCRKRCCFPWILA